MTTTESSCRNGMSLSMGGGGEEEDEGQGEGVPDSPHPTAQSGP